jgi:hypothetical protein
MLAALPAGAQSAAPLATGKAPASAPAPTQAATTAPVQAGGGAPAPGPEQGTAQGGYTLKLRDLERRVDELKEQIFRSKARLNLLKETVLHGVVAGARGVIVHRNEMGALYMPVRLIYALDGAEIFAKSDDAGKLLDGKELEIFNGSLLPGNHTLSVTAVYQGNGFGIFSYLKGYKFTVRASHSFTAPEGKVTTIKVVGYEKGNAFTTDPKDRPALEFRSNVGSERDQKKGK